MRKLGIALCGLFGGIGATVGFFAPNDATTGSIMGAMAVFLGIADFVIRDSLKLMDERITREVGRVRTAFKIVPFLDAGRGRLLRINFIAMACKGVAAAVAGLASLGKAKPLTLAVGGAFLAVGLVLTIIILLSHETLVTKANQDAVNNAEEEAAKNAIKRLGTISKPVDIPEHPVIALNGKQPKAPRKKPGTK